MANAEIQNTQNAGGKKKRRKGCLIAAVVAAAILLTPILVLWGVFAYQEAMDKKYGGYGFAYMHGWSSTDFTGYHVYDGEKLAVLDHPAALLIEGVENMPVLDGAEACYPLYAAFAKAIYKDIDAIERDAQETYEEIAEKGDKWVYDHWEEWKAYQSWRNGRVVSFYNTIRAYNRLIDKEVDLVFGASPSARQIEDAQREGETIVPIPIGREGFVFLVEEDNPIDGLTSEEIRRIYSGEITNWRELGGKNQKITAFQRPESSGSQVMMEYFMGQTPLMEPDTYTMIGAMGDVIEQVKQYHHERGAVGYTFHYFLTGLQQEKGVKMLAVDGVYPSIESIEDGSYPLVVQVVCSKLASNDKPEVQAVIDFVLSDDGQELLRKTGYAPLHWSA